jgi:hypothetical protein
MSPVCSRRDATPHHFVFRSHGGGDDDDNVGMVCTWCHLEGIHGGRIKAEPPLENARWILGRIPILIVKGRKRVQLEGAASVAFDGGAA